MLLIVDEKAQPIIGNLCISGVDIYYVYITRFEPPYKQGRDPARARCFVAIRKAVLKSATRRLYPKFHC